MRQVIASAEMHSAAPELIGSLEPVFIAETEEERQAIYSFRYSVYGRELGSKVGVDHERKVVYDEEDEKPYTTLLFTEDGESQLTGTIRVRRWEPGQVPAKEWGMFSMERFEGLDSLIVAELGRFMIAPGNRGQMGLLSMACAMYQLYAGELGTDVCFCNCVTGLVRHYRLLGFRTYSGELVPSVDGITVPLVLFPSDGQYLEQAGSFLVPFVDVFFGHGLRAQLDIEPWTDVLDADSVPVRFDKDAVRERVDRLRRFLAPQPTLLELLSPDTARNLIDKGFLMRLSAGQLLTEKGLSQQEIFVILDGAFEVHDGDRKISVLSRGDVIGEVGFFGSAGRRSASVTAASNGEVLVVRRHFLDELQSTDPTCAAEILFQLGRVLADRFAANQPWLD